jgi:RNA polymerase sigma factor (sigma-70 family)
MTEAAASGPSRGRVAGLPLRGPARLLSDERLARRATGGDQHAFEEIFRRYHQDLYRFCLATVSSPQDAQEALQNTMVKVMRALPGEERAIKLKPWLFRIARNEAIETLRKRRDTVQLDAELLASPSEIAVAADARERLRELLADLTELPERQRSALVMRELAGLEFAEIGEAFGTSAAVARQTLYEARQSLRQMDEGREMSCATVRQAISDADGRVTRRRDVRAHLRDCVGCRAFRDDIARRRQEFAAIAPLPAAVAIGLLQGALGGQAGATLAAGAGSAAGGGIGTAIGAGAGKAAVGSAIVKSAATVAVVAAVGAGADRGGLIDLPTPGGGEPATKSEASPGGDSGEPSGTGGVGSMPDASHATGPGRDDGAAKSPGDAPGGDTGVGNGRKGAAGMPAGRGHHPGKGKKGKDAKGKHTKAHAPAHKRSHGSGGKRPVTPPPPAASKPGSAGRETPPAPSRKPPEQPADDGAPSVQPSPESSPPPQSSQPPKAESPAPSSPAPQSAPTPGKEPNGAAMPADGAPGA